MLKGTHIKYFLALSPITRMEYNGKTLEVATTKTFSGISHEQNYLWDFLSHL